MWTSGKMGSAGCLRTIITMSIGVMMMAHTASAARRSDRLLPVRPTAEVLREIADAVGAAKFEELTVDSLADASRPITRVLNTANPDASVEYLTYQGVMGRPGIDFPVLPSIPHTDFNCKKVATGYYADLETDCQVFHICDGGRKISFLCPNGTIFRQSHLICDWWFKVDCNESPDLYEESAEHLAEDQRKRERANKQPTNQKNFDNILSTNKRTSNNLLSDAHSSNEYKAEASFTSIAQSAPVKVEAVEKNQNNDRRNQKRYQNPTRSDKTTNSRQYSSFEASTDNNENRRQNNANNYKISTTRRSTTEYTDAAIYRSSTPSSKNSKETQIAEESASFASSRGRNNFYPYSTVFESRARSNSEISASSIPSARTTRPTYTTTYVPGTKNYVEVTRSVSQSITSTSRPSTTTPEIISTPSKSGNTNDDHVSYSFIHYNQYPTTIIPHNHFKVATNHSEVRKGKGFSAQGFEKITSQNKTVRNSYPLNDKNKNQSFYAPTVPTITPKSISSRTSPTYDWSKTTNYETTTIPTKYAPTTYSSYTTMPPAVSEHAIEMIKTLDELELGSIEPTTETDKILGRRPGLIVPPSAGPNTLHSLAIYFATAVDSLVTTPEPTVATDDIAIDPVTESEKSLEENGDSYTSLLSRNTLDKYTDLFKNSSSSDHSTESVEDVHNDLDLQQSRGPLTSSPQIRELAQVFTHALSAYLQDPETFRKVLSEIRPTDPAPYNDVSTTSNGFDDTTAHNEYASVTKEEDEVLDFSDVSKNKPKQPTRPTSYESNRYNKDRSVIKSTVSYQIESKNKDRTPGSRFITQGSLEDEDEDGEYRQGKELSTTSPTPSKNPIAQEINGLSSSNNKVPQVFIRNQKKINNTDIFDSSYFPIPNENAKYGGFQNNSSDYSPYGSGVRPSNSTPIGSTAYTSTNAELEALPLQWGDVISTKASKSSINPNAPSYDLLPPESTQQNNKLDSVEMSVLNSFVPEDLNDLADFNKTNYGEYTTEVPTQHTEGSTARYVIYNTESDIYDDKKVINDNDEQLQRAQSQSFVASKNQIGRRGKKIKNQKNDVNSDDKINSTVTVRTSNGLLLSLPTLKDILSKPTSYSDLKSTDPTPFDDVTVSTVNPEGTTNFDASTTADYTDTTSKIQGIGSTSQYNIWSTSAALGHIWQTTVFLDPMTINDGLTSDLSGETIQPSANTYYPRAVTQVWNSDLKNYESTTATPTEQTDSTQYSTYTTPVYTEYPTIAAEDVTTVVSKKSDEGKLPTYNILVKNNEYFDQFKKINQPIPNILRKDREGKSLNSDALEKLNSSDVDLTMMSKAKEMFGGLNASSANTLMNVMKQADKNTTVRRLILLLIQTCDDDHNKTLEASRTALLDALIRFPVQEKDTTYSQIPLNENLELKKTNPIKDNDLSYNNRRSDEIFDTEDTKRPQLPKLSERRGKSFDDPTTAKFVSSTTTAATTTTTTTSTTQAPTSPAASPVPVVTIQMSRRGNRKYIIKSTRTPINPKQFSHGDSFSSVEKGNTVSLEDQSVPSDTRALELLRSLYSLAARWG